MPLVHELRHHVGRVLALQHGVAGPRRELEQVQRHRVSGHHLQGPPERFDARAGDVPAAARRREQQPVLGGRRAVRAGPDPRCARVCGRGPRDQLPAGRADEHARRGAAARRVPGSGSGRHGERVDGAARAAARRAVPGPGAGGRGGGSGHGVAAGGAGHVERGVGERGAGHAGVRAGDGARQDRARAGAGGGVDHGGAGGGRGHGDRADGARAAAHHAVRRHVHGGPGLRGHERQRGHPAAAARGGVGRERRRAARGRHGARLRALPHPGTGAAAGVAAGGVVQPARAVRRGDGGGRGLRGHRAPVGGGAAQAAGGGQGGLRAAGRHDGHGHGADAGERGAHAVREGVPRAPVHHAGGQAPDDHDPDGRRAGVRPDGRGRPQLRDRAADGDRLLAARRRGRHGAGAAVLVLVPAAAHDVPRAGAHRRDRPQRGPAAAARV
mmetsp:Transcript_29696/g.97109  ORF Transcript_29696/g.97109 Transcript_29696/m.97109 type:complete len:441 (-) Transcript_29696:280-1602(-)